LHSKRKRSSGFLGKDFICGGFFLITLLAVLLAPCGCFSAEEPHVLYRGDALTILGDVSMAGPADGIRGAYPEIKRGLEEALGWPLLSRPTVVLTGDGERFKMMSGSELFSAFAVPSRATIVVYVSPSALRPYVLNEIFEHELCHLLLHDHIPSQLLPKWLDEGICQWVSGSLGEILLGKGLDSAAIEAIEGSMPLDRLSKSFPQDKQMLFLAYLESRRFVEFISARYGREKLILVLNHLSEGSSIDEAMRQVLGKPPGAVEVEWRESLRSRSRWLLWGSQHLYDVLFLLAALLTVIGFLRMVRRKKRSFEEDEEDDEEQQQL
jgi:hypothetical protein